METLFEKIEPYLNSFKSIQTLVNQILEPTMALSDLSHINKEIGNIRIAMFMTSYLGTVVISAILDQTKRFKLITLINSATFLLSYDRVFNRNRNINNQPIRTNRVRTAINKHL